MHQNCVPHRQVKIQTTKQKKGNVRPIELLNGLISL